ncbi:MAG: hypothetical protein DIU68_004600 [Chloroflexota bacterium]
MSHKGEAIMVTLFVHLNNAEPFKLDLDEMPKPGDQMIIGKNPRDRADREVNWIEDGVTTVIIPMWRVVYLEVLPSSEEETAFPLPFRNE